MNKILTFLTKVLLIFGLIVFAPHKAFPEDPETVLEELRILREDIKTLEKAVNSQEFKSSGVAKHYKTIVVMY